MKKIRIISKIMEEIQKQKCKNNLFLDRMDNKFMKRLLNKDDIENGLEFHKNYLDKVDDMDMSWQKLYS